MNSRRWLGLGLIAAGPLLAGTGRAGGWSVGLFAMIAVLVLAAWAETWRTPFHLAAAAAGGALAAAALFLLGCGLASGAHWGALGPLALSGAGAVLVLTRWFPVRR